MNVIKIFCDNVLPHFNFFNLKFLLFPFSFCSEENQYSTKVYDDKEKEIFFFLFRNNEQTCVFVCVTEMKQKKQKCRENIS